MSALTRRVLAAAVLVPLVVAAVLWLPTPGFALVLGAFALVGAHEWGRVGQLGRRRGVAFMALVALSLAGSYLALGHSGLTAAVLALAMGWWLLALVWVVRFQGGDPVAALSSTWVRVAVGWLVLVPAWYSLVALHQHRAALVMYVLVLIWVADSAAYFAGRRFGRRRLASRVSPGKSWEGVAAGLAAVAVLAAGAARADGASVAGLVVLSLAVAAASVLGDLAESLFKRRAGVKDSGTLIPGHGGVLDRIDSLTAAGPCFAVGWLLTGGSL